MNALKIAALVATFACATSAAALAQTCPAGTALLNGVCQRAPAPVAANPPPVGSTIPAMYDAGKPTVWGWPSSAGGDCAPGYVLADFGGKKGCYPAR